MESLTIKLMSVMNDGATTYMTNMFSPAAVKEWYYEGTDFVMGDENEAYHFADIEQAVNLKRKIEEQLELDKDNDEVIEVAFYVVVD